MRQYREVLLSAAITGDTSPATTRKMFGGDYALDVAGTLAGATVKLQALAPDEVTWMDLASVTVAGRSVVQLGAYDNVRATITGGAAVGVYVAIAQIRQ